jgi:uncharacterized surface protein with fasciclin (FAS1) repeats
MKMRAWMPAMVAAGLLAGCSQSMMASPTPTAAATPMAAADPTPVMVGGAPMLASKTIVANAVNSNDNTTLVAAVKAAGLVDTLNGPGPFTVFAPTDEAFAALPKGTVATLVKPANKATLTKILTYHVVPGTMDFASLSKAVTAAGGTLTLTTVAGLPLTVTMNGPHNLLVTDAKGGVAHITTYDVYQSNGVIQVIDKVLLPG